MVGIITLEDIIEAIIQAEVSDRVNIISTLEQSERANVQICCLYLRMHESLLSPDKSASLMTQLYISVAQGLMLFRLSESFMSSCTITR